ncbi:MAG: MarC family protein [Thermoplasmata archaeon]|jgi:multiple antibiotic resistance protein|nr:MarC family protein [Thermoplasmata archaeon]
MAIEFLMIFIPMFIIIDPVGTLPLYIAMTASMDKAARRRTLEYAIVFAASLLVAFALVGTLILDYLSVSIDALMISGGLLLLVIGISMLYEGDMPRSKRKGAEDEPEERQSPEDIAFVPLGTPLLAGPGAISVVIVMSGTADMPLVIASLLLVMFICALILFWAASIYRLIGKAGSRALTRVMGLITSAYAVQMILDGIYGYVSGL